MYYEEAKKVKNITFKMSVQSSEEAVTSQNIDLKRINKKKS
jgi:hypothetical protein